MPRNRRYPLLILFVCFIGLLTLPHGPFDVARTAAARSAAPPACGVPSFRGAPSFNAGPNHSVAVADLNNDGRADIITANEFANTVVVLLGDGQGFSQPASFPAGGIRPWAVVSADFNKDGKADVAVTTTITGGSQGHMWILLGDGAGGFAAPTVYQTGRTDILDVTTGDFNGDGNVDLAMTASGDSSVKVALGNGAGGFGPLSTFAVGAVPRGIVAADFNLDGRADLAVVNDGSHSLSVLLGDGAGGFTVLAPFAVGTNPRHLAAADFNNDGKTDLAVGNYGSLNVSVLPGAGDGQFGAPLNLQVGSPVGYVVAADFNNDGNADFASGSTAVGVSVRLGNGAGQFGAAKNFRPSSGDMTLAVVDFNLDGSDDVVALPSQSGMVIALAGDGAGNLAVTPGLTTGNTNVSSVALGDINGDGRLDAVLSHDNNNNVSVRLGDGAGSFGNPTSYATGTRPWWVATGDFNGDGRADVVTANFLSANVSVLLADGAGGLGPAAHIGLTNFYPSFVAVADVNKDNKADLLVIRDNVFVVSVLLGDGAGGFGAPTHFETAPNPRAVAVGDFNADGNPDLAVSDNHVSVLLGNGAGGFGARINTHFGDNTGPRGIVAADFNADGKSDVALVNEFNDNVSVLIGTGTGTFSPRVNHRVGGDPASIVTADFNGDGLHDLAVGNYGTQSASVLLGDGAGGFGPAYDWAVAANPNAVAAGDLNADGKTDLVAAGFNSLALLLNTCGEGAQTAAPLLSVNDATVAEPDAGTADAVFNVSLSAPSAQAVSVKYVLSGAGARRGVDFQGATGTLTFAPGVTTQTLSVTVNGDTTDEFDESFGVRLFEPVNALIADRHGSGTITDNDAPPTISIGNASAAEGQTNSALGFAVTLSQASGKLVTVAYATGGGTATPGADYISAAGTLSITAGATSGLVNVQVLGDGANEPDETFNVTLTNPSNATLSAAQGVGTIINDDTPRVQLGAAAYAVAEGAGVDISVARSGDATGEAFVSYATSDGSANSRQDYTPALGRLRFAPGETSKTVRVVTTDDRFDDDGEGFTFTLTDPAGVELGATAAASVNITDNDPADGPSPVGDAAFDATFFVRQHYLDFLSREPDAPGLAHWTNQMTNCGNPNLEVCRINVSAAFFQAIEFQQTGYLVYRTYKAAYGDATSPGVPGTVPVVRLDEFLTDTQRIGEGVVVHVGDWEAQLAANKEAYALEFVRRTRFTNAFPPTMTAAEFVDKLIENAGITLTTAERDQLVSTLGATPADASKRAQVLRAVAEHQQLRDNEFRRAFVLMQYFGYLRRNPDDAPERDLNYAGWKFWLDKLNEFNGNFVHAEMVKAFISSDEYKKRFGQ